MRATRKAADISVLRSYLGLNVSKVLTITKVRYYARLIDR